jgi:hypothetical protein
MLSITDPHTLLDLHHQRVAELQAEAAADGLARRVRAGARHRRPSGRFGLLRRAAAA